MARLGPVPPAAPGAPVGVVAAADPAGALGRWQTEAAVAVAVPDLTRPLDPRPALEALEANLRGPRTVVVGLGLHRPLSAAELEPLSPWSPVQHDPDDCVQTELVDGIPGAVGRPLAEADWSVSVGVAELHQYAGVSGGHKGVAVGCGGRATLAALHARKRVLDPAVTLGTVRGNPFRAAVDALGQAAGCRLALVWVPACQLWLAGEPRAVVREAAARIRPWVSVERPAPGAVLSVPAAKASSFYQASRALTYLALSPRPPLEEGAILAIEAACPEGLGHESGFRRALQGTEPPWGALLTGPEPTGAGAQRAVVLAKVAQRYQIRVYGCAQPAALEAVGIQASARPAPRPSSWLRVEAPFARLPQLVEAA